MVLDSLTLAIAVVVVVVVDNVPRTGSFKAVTFLESITAKIPRKSKSESLKQLKEW